jgi:hypothetical protein
MKTQYQQPETGGLPGTRQRHARYPVFWLPELDTYKHLLQPNSHAASAGFSTKKITYKRRAVKLLRTVLYSPVEHLSELPGGPLRYMWILRLVVKLDAPLRNYLLRGFHVEKLAR